MAEISDRSLFLESIKTQPMTVNDIVEQYNVARNTARNWVKHPEVEKVIGSYPHQYVRKGSFELEETPKQKLPSKTKDVVIIELPKPPKDLVDKMFHMVLDNHPDARFNFTEEFRMIDSLAGIAEIKKHLNTAYVVVNYYEQLLKDEE